MTSSLHESLLDKAGHPSGEIGLFVLWEMSRPYKDEVLADISRCFSVMAGFEIHWTPELVRRNFERFYCDVPIRGVYHEMNKGAGPFVALIVMDRSPVYACRETSRGLRRVNVHLSELKQRYREEHHDLGLHCSETAAEASRDITMLLGADVFDRADKAEWNGTLRRLDRDVTGAHGWESAHQLFRTLNRTVDYVVLGSAEQPAGALLLAGSGPTLLSTDHQTVVRVLDGAPRRGLTPRHGGRFLVEVEGRRVPINVRSVDEGFMDRNWARRCLNNRTMADGEDVYRPPHPDDVASGWHLSAIEGSSGDAGSVGAAGGGGSGEIDHKIELSEFMRARHYGQPRPVDKLVVGTDIFTTGSRPTDSTRPLVRHIIVGWRRLSVLSRTGYLAARDEIVFRAPRLRSLVRSLVRS